MKNEKRFVKYDKELQIEAYWFQGILQKFPQHFHEYYVLGLLRRVACVICATIMWIII